MANFFAELKRRNVFRVGAAYAVVAWVLLQLVTNLTPALRLPEWASSLVVVLLMVGFPVALIFTWAHELPPETEASARASTGKLDWFLASALVVVIALVSYQQLAPAVEGRTAQVQQQVGVVAARQASLSPSGAISLAVLPFTNLSSDPEQEFFSDGMTEEITSALARIPDLRVVGRTSAYQFKGQDQDLRGIGQALSATHLLEGSVRKEGNRLRITAQLIEAKNGVHVWTESYNRELTGVFAIQEEIATAIAGSLRVPLGLQAGERLVSNRNIDPESYQHYLRAKALAHGRSYTEAINLLETVTTRDPNYAPAWALLARAHAGAPNFHPAFWNGEVEELRRLAAVSLPNAEAAARRAIALDPNLSDGYLALGNVHYRRGELLLAEELYTKALALDPNNPEALGSESGLLGGTGFIKEALLMRQRMLALEPFVPIFMATTASIQWVNGQTDAAIKIFTNLPDGPARSGSTDLARILAAAGRYSEAADAVSAMSEPFARETVEAATRLLRTAPAAAASPQNLPRLGGFDFVYLHVGVPDRALEFYEGNIEAGYSNTNAISWLWHLSYAPVRKTERFKAFVRKAGLVDYWRVKGWPEFCRATGSDDFVCV